MDFLTRNPASALHAASADQSNALRLLQRQLPTQSNITVATEYKGITGLIDCRTALARLLQEVARPLPVQAPASDQCRRPPAVPVPPQPANADGTCLSVQGSPKHASKPECKGRSSRRPCAFCIAALL